MNRDSNFPCPIRVRLKNEANSDQIFFVTVSSGGGVEETVTSIEGYREYPFLIDGRVHKVEFKVYNQSLDGNKVVNKYLGYFVADLVHDETKEYVESMSVNYIEQKSCFVFGLLQTSLRDFDVILTRPIS